MAKLLLNLRHVLEDEHEDVRAMLAAHGIAYYETQPSLWGVSQGGIWLSRDHDLAMAKRLMTEYQHTRAARVRAEYAAAKRDGTAETFANVLRERPLQVLMTVLAIACLLGLVALPVWLLHR